MKKMSEIFFYKVYSQINIFHPFYLWETLYVHARAFRTSLYFLYIYNFIWRIYHRFILFIFLFVLNIFHIKRKAWESLSTLYKFPNLTNTNMFIWNINANNSYYLYSIISVDDVNCNVQYMNLKKKMIKIRTI